MDIDKLEKLQQLKEKGVITEEEFQTAKEKIINGEGESNFEMPDLSLTDIDDQKTYVTFLHLSVLLGSFVPWLGYLVPFVMWFTKKDTVPRVDRHGRVVMNWILSSFIFSIISTVLIIFFGLGLLLLGVLWLANIIFSIMGAIKANDGILWAYPGSFSFFTLPPKGNDEIYKHLETQD